MLTYSNVKFNESGAVQSVPTLPNSTGLVAEDRTGPMVKRLDAAITHRDRAEKGRSGRARQDTARSGDRDRDTFATGRASVARAINQ